MRVYAAGDINWFADNNKNGVYCPVGIEIPRKYVSVSVQVCWSACIRVVVAAGVIAVVVCLLLVCVTICFSLFKIFTFFKSLHLITVYKHTNKLLDGQNDSDTEVNCV